MTSTVTPSPTTDRPSLSPAARRFGYVMAIVANAIMLWLAHQLLGWEWPSFLTDDFDQVLGLITASFVASMVVNAGYLVHDRGRFRALGDLVVAAFGFVVSLRMWNVFPFDFSGWETDWSWLVRTALVVGIVGTAIAMIVNLGRLARG